MSLLEDVFLQDEAGEAQELERVIEGDEYDELPRALSPNSDDNSEKDDEAEEDKRRVDPAQVKTKRVIKNPRFILNPARLTGPRGIQVIPEHFKDFKFKGKGHEKDDLDMVLKKLEHWAYRLYPKFKFDDCLKKIETLGKKRPVMVHLHKIRTDQFASEETVVQKDSSDEDDTPMPPQEEDEFDKLLQQQIELARATPAPRSVKKPGFSTPRCEKSPLTMPKATSSPSISDEQRERILKNRRLAEERRLAKLKQNSTETNTVIDEMPKVDLITEEKSEAIKTITMRKHNRSNVIDSSDDECEMTAANQSIVVEVHQTLNKNSGKEKNDDRINDNDIGHSKLDDEINKSTENSELYNKYTDLVANEVVNNEKSGREMDNNIQVEENSEIISSSPSIMIRKSKANDEIGKYTATLNQNISSDNINNCTQEIDGVNENSKLSELDNEHVFHEKIQSQSPTKDIVKLIDQQTNKINYKNNLSDVGNNEVDDIMDVDFNDEF